MDGGAGGSLEEVPVALAVPLRNLTARNLKLERWS